ncbi:MAG: class I SAM-dependent methyltransferase [Actinoallomurus sp.]
MEPGQPSRTAMSAAHARATHQADSLCVFPDPLALRVIGADPASPPQSGMPAEVRLFMAIRHRLAEDALATAVAIAGTRQVVILGAGLDTLAYRTPHPRLRVFEVDHPDTQAWKRKRLADAGIPVPETVVYCPVDFDEQTLDAGLAGSGFDREAPAFFVWLGVVPYLTRDLVLATLGFVAGLSARSEIVFDYNQPASALPSERRPMLAALAEAMAERGEPWQSFFTPDGIAADLTDAGFDTAEDLGWPECLERYALDTSKPDLFGGRVVHATSGPRLG